MTGAFPFGQSAIDIERLVPNLRDDTIVDTSLDNSSTINESLPTATIVSVAESNGSSSRTSSASITIPGGGGGGLQVCFSKSSCKIWCYSSKVIRYVYHPPFKITITTKKYQYYNQIFEKKREDVLRKEDEKASQDSEENRVWKKISENSWWTSSKSIRSFCYEEGYIAWDRSELAK